MEALIVFLPLVGALVAGFGGRAIAGHKGDLFAQIVSSGLLVLAAIFAWITFINVGILAHDAADKAYTINLLHWVAVGDFAFDWALRIDTLTAVMLVVVTSVSSVVHIYSIGYMHHDPSIPRFQAYLSLFTFMMLMLVTADNLVQMFFGWEGVGLASYLLIGFWYKKPSANAAAIKAFVVNRVGDFGFALGIFGTFVMTGSLGFDAIFAAIPGIVEGGDAGQTFQFLWMTLTPQEAITCICLLLFMGAMGKSAQLGLHTWLPDAMEGPTPVSALIHAATMVTAGVFMVCRLSPIFEYSETALTVVTFVGAMTAFFAATVGLTQNDIKRVIAYSTCSQLGYMFFAAGVSAYPAAMFHLFTHAFFKALLFLGAGSVIHAVSDEQDMRKMGGLAPHIKKTMVMMWIGSLALGGIGIPGTQIGFAGFFSKDAILESAYGAHTGIGMFAFWMGIAAAVMTAFYSWRLLWMTFHTPARADERVMAHVHESPNVMLVPLYLLAIGAVFAGVVFAPYFTGHHFAEFWGDSIKILEEHKALENAHHVPVWVKMLPLVVGIIGIAGAVWVYRSGLERGRRIGEFWGPFYQFSLNKWYFDELYNFLFVRPAFAIGRFFWKRGDGQTIDGLGPDGVAKTTAFAAGRLSLLQTGYLYHYAFAMLIGVVVLVSFYLLAH
ncbi:NADH-quinone oxidoreductase subunit L [Rhodospirillaceae bacterium KN72]|uniref:NADH-ubiquinone oxidoreductase chain 5 n=1 Tax=Pacificispira spongiicola TaxID=2729598 RepID=A0A7Y0HI11_9PROT|nr:NADH-quinone oxidoreductase subunit L [Pacificispira spongiicola]NMM46029.1 NADH-quinone oxidoreductase subunit L [Pacificispira spongiicola]